MEVYKTHQKVEGMKKCMKKPIPVHAKQINVPFRVETLEGNYKQGKPGGYLMRGVLNELYICDQEIFEMSYDWLTEKEK